MKAAPLLLTAGEDAPEVLDLSLQVNDARCARGEFGAVFVCEADAAGIEEDVPEWVYALGRVGCIEVCTYTLQQVRAGHSNDSYLLFRGRAEFRAAYSLARRLAKATRGNPAMVLPEEWAAITWAILSDRQPFVNNVWEGGGL